MFSVDALVEKTSLGTAVHREARRVQRLITSRLRPELGVKLDDRDGDE